MMILHGRDSSSNVQRPMWLLHELGIEFEQRQIGWKHGGNKEASYLAHNPNGLVPTLEDNGFFVWESNTISRYLASKYRAESMYPGDLKRRAIVEQWMDWGITLTQAITPAFWGIMRVAQAERDLGAIQRSCESMDKLMRVLDAALRDRPYLLGDEFTLADIANGINVYRWYNVPFQQVGFEIPTLPNLQRWYERLQTRPAYQKVVMINIE